MRAINYDYLIGNKINRLKVISYFHKNRRTYAECECECGNKSTPTMQSLLNGHSKSCGCLNRENLNKSRTTHNKSNTKIYKVYHSMIDRCSNHNMPNFSHYGGRGIKVCEEWKNNFEQFYEWAINNGYREGLSIDRIDVNGNYEPSNCRWVTTYVQNLNKRNSSFITYKGVRKTITEWGKDAVCGVQSFRGRIGAGWDMERALTEPKRVTLEERDQDG